MMAPLTRTDSTARKREPELVALRGKCKPTKGTALMKTCALAHRRDLAMVRCVTHGSSRLAICLTVQKKNSKS